MEDIGDIGGYMRRIYEILKDIGDIGDIEGYRRIYEILKDIGDIGGYRRYWRSLKTYEGKLVIGK